MHRNGFNVVLALSALLASAATTIFATAHAAVPNGNGALLAEADARTPTQLPRDVRPTHYAITITPDAARLVFKGEVTIDIDVLMPTRRIVLNALDLEFAQVALISTDGARTPREPRVAIDPMAQTASFAFDSVLAPGSYRLAMHYTGKIGTQAAGLFALDYDSPAGTRRALYTQFENSDARRFIPCWDEPLFKTTFDLVAVVPAEQMAISNMPVAQRITRDDGTARIVFARSPSMSSYLLFFGLGDFERAIATQGTTEIGVVTQRGKTAQAAFALESAKAILVEYNDYFDTPYPLPKLDNVAGPGSSQFFGAMENWGAIFTFKNGLLLDPAISTQEDKQRVFNDAAHEMAHQWFGDLVTMRWWDDLWLNEGFASWMQGRSTERLHPEWNTALKFVAVRERAMERDALVTTHPVVQHIATVEQASQAFDSITYSKGQAVIRMLEGYVGAEAWRDGVRHYIKAHAYGSTASDDLWRAVEASAGKPVLRIAHEFTLQPGVPLIRVEHARCVNGQTELQLTQGEFSNDRPHKVPLQWSVPLIAHTLGNPTPASTLVRGHATMQVPGCGTLVVNAGQSGYYRTLYSPPQMAAIRDHFDQLAPIDQLGVFKDALALGLNGLQPTTDFLDLLQHTAIDTDPQVWAAIAESLTTIDRLYDGKAARQVQFRHYANARLAPVLARIGWLAKPDESTSVTNLRATLIDTLGALDDADVIAEARRRYAVQASNPAALPTALRKTVVGVVARHADGATWDQLHAAAIAESTPLVKDELYVNLSSTLDDQLARRALDLALTDEPGATNSARMIATVADLHPELAFDFATSHRAQVDPKIDSTSRSRYYPSLASNSLDAAVVARINVFAKAHIAPTSRLAAETAIATIQHRIELRDKRLPAIDAWLKKASPH